MERVAHDTNAGIPCFATRGFTRVELLVVLAIMLFLGCLLGGWAAAPLLLTFGWLPFLLRTLPRMSVEPVAVGVALGAGIVGGLLMHGFASWLWENIRSRPDGSSSRWRWRWSLSIIGLMILSMAAGIASTVSVHQMGWLVASGEPLVESRSPILERMGSRNRLGELGIAALTYEETHSRLPPGGTFDEWGSGMHSWETLLLPYLEASVEPDLSLPWGDPRNLDAYRQVVPEFTQPHFERVQERGESGYALSHYAINSRVAGPNRSLAAEDVGDGRANTLLIGEVTRGFRAWGDPVNWRDPALGLGHDDERFSGPDTQNGVQFLMLDGSVRFFGSDTDPSVLESLASPGGDHAIPE